MRHTPRTKKIDQHGNIISEAEEAIAKMLMESVGEEGPQLLKDDEEESEEDEEDIDIEANDTALTNIVSQDAIEDDLEPETNTQPTMQVVSLEDVKELLKSIISGPTQSTEMPVVETQPSAEVTLTPAADQSIAQDATATPSQKGLVGGEEALKKVYFQGEGNETLDSEFDFTKDSANALESKVDVEDSYIDSINGLPIAYADFEDVAQQPQQAIARAAEGNPHVYGGSTTYDDMDGGEFENPDMARLEDGDNDFGMDGNPSSDEFSYDEECEEEEELLLDTDGEPEPEEEEMTEAPDEFDYEGEGHPDLHRIVGPIDPIEGDEEEFETPEVEEEPIAQATPETVTTNSVSNIGGQQVQIILTGVMITAPELNYIGEAVAKTGTKLKKISGEGNKLQIVVEANENQYTINYIDAPRTKEPTPFSIKNYKFGTLEEALGRINHNNVPKTQRVFKTIINEDYASRNINQFRESDIFEGVSENVSYTGTWTIKAVGSVNLKSGLNETYSNIIQHGKEPNTLVKSTEGNYFMIKGNLKERSKKGVKKELVDVSRKMSYGICEVVGTFENTHKGLGQIMESIQRTSIPLLVWK